VLVFGSGDYSMPAHVLWAYREERTRIDLHVLDRCETPLALSRWYARRVGAAVTTAQVDAPHYRPEHAFDVVVTNSFLGYFDRDARRRLFACWGDSLRPGGKLLFTNRLRPNSGDDPIGFSEAQAARLVEAVRREAQSRGDTIDIGSDEMVLRARRYAERFRSYPLHSADEVIDLLRRNGFSIDRLDTATAAARAENDAVSGPSTAEQTDYVRVSAIRC
jgi:SAM-dependent methyltransferase